MMTEEELRKEATSTVEWECTPVIDRPLFVHAYITGAEPREKQIDTLEQQNEKMKSLLKEIYEEYGFSELVKIRNDLPIEIQEVIKDINER